MPRPIQPVPVDPDATASARRLLAMLAEDYGRGTFTGVISQTDAESIRSLTGQTPAIMGGDLMDYSPSRLPYGADARNETERLIAAARAGHIVTLCWHWNAPRDLVDQPIFVNRHGQTIDASWYRGFYTDATTFDFTPAVVDPRSEERRLIERDIDAIADQLRKLAAADVPVLWRPLHESDGGWFWWGARGAEPLRRLWRLLFDRLVHHHDLHNLIWVYTWNDPAWYPGDEVVDLIGIDAYPANVSELLESTWTRALRRFDGRKLIALTEFGGVPDIPRMQERGIWWGYFASWTGEQGPEKTPAQDVARIYRSPGTMNADRLSERRGDFPS